MSVVEVVAWFMFKMEDYAFPRFYFNTIGYYGSFLLVLPPFFAVLQITAGQGGATDFFPGTWTLFLVIVGFLGWALHAALHVVFVPYFIAYIDNQPPKACECDLP